MYSFLLITLFHIFTFTFVNEVIRPATNAGPDAMLLSDGVLICFGNKISSDGSVSTVDIMNNHRVTAIENWYSHKLKNSIQSRADKQWMTLKLEAMKKLVFFEEKGLFHTLIRVHCVLPGSVNSHIHAGFYPGDECDMVFFVMRILIWYFGRTSVR